MRVGIYVRVSTGKQDTENQLDQLRNYCVRRGWKIEQIYQETISGKERNRPEFSSMLEDARKGIIDCILVWALDRFTREGTERVWFYLGKLKDYNVSFVSYQEQFLSTDNELVRDVLYSLKAALAKQERFLISERTKAGLERTKRNGTKLGRPETLNNGLRDQAVELRKRGFSYSEIGRRLNVPAGSVPYLVKKVSENPRTK